MTYVLYVDIMCQDPFHHCVMTYTEHCVLSVADLSVQVVTADNHFRGMPLAKDTLRENNGALLHDMFKAYT